MTETALQRRQREEAERVARAREQLPESTAHLDEWRASFGPGCRLTFAQEGRNRFGEPGPEGVQASDSSPSVKARRESHKAEKAIVQLRQRELA